MKLLSGPSRRRRSAGGAETLNFWPAVADMMLAALIVVLLLAFGMSVVEYIRRWQIAQIERKAAAITEQLASVAKKLTDLIAERAKLQSQLEEKSAAQKKLEDAIALAQAELEQAKSSEELIALTRLRIKDLEELLKKLEQTNSVLVKQRKPPNITISDVDTFTFGPGQAKLDSKFEEYLIEKSLPVLISTFRDYPVEVIEIIGHTDKQTASGRVSNLDKELGPVLEGKKEVSVLQFGSNADLGLMRAVALRLFLEKQLRQLTDEQAARFELKQEQRARLQRVQIRTYSAAQAVPSARSVNPAADSPTDRRIEIRFTKLTD